MNTRERRGPCDGKNLAQKQPTPGKKSGIVQKHEMTEQINAMAVWPMNGRQQDIDGRETTDIQSDCHGTGILILSDVQFHARSHRDER